MPLTVPMLAGVVVADVFEDAALARRERDAQQEHQTGAGVNVQADRCCAGAVTGAAITAGKVKTIVVLCPGAK